jgi:hypothetical protein
MKRISAAVCFIFFLIFPVFYLRSLDTGSEKNLAAFADPARIWGKGVEAIIEEAYRQCFKTYILEDQIMNLRMPFAQNNERDQLLEQSWEFAGGGKADPVILWGLIDDILASGDFRAYIAALSDGREKVIIFDIPGRAWSVSRDLFDIARMKAGAYHGLPHKPYVLVSGRGLNDTDVYNYLYCIGWAGMDCSGFVWHVLSYIAAKGGVNLGQTLRRTLGIPRGGDPSYYVGTWVFNSRSPEIVAVNDQVRNIRSADIILFRGSSGGMVHSAIVQSVDFNAGVIRYLQSTDEAPLADRGVHESFIYFDPANAGVSLHDPSLVWSQRRYAPFPGEEASAFSDDGNRYRAFPEFGAGRVVRLRTLNAQIQRLKK